MDLVTGAVQLHRVMLPQLHPPTQHIDPRDYHAGLTQKDDILWNLYLLFVLYYLLNYLVFLFSFIQFSILLFHLREGFKF